MVCNTVDANCDGGAVRVIFGEPDLVDDLCVCYISVQVSWDVLKADWVNGVGPFNLFALRELYSLAQPAKLCSIRSVPG